MGNIIPELHLVLLVVEFIWSALSSYAQTVQGAAQLQEIEDIANALDGNPNTPASGNQATSESPSLAQRRAERGI